MPFLIDKILTPRIHLLMSVYLSDTPLGDPGFYGNHISPTQSKVDQFLSTIHSLTHIKFNSAEIYFDADLKYRNLFDKILEHIKLNIPNADVHEHRLEFFSDWQQVSRNLPSETEVVLLKNNHDHIFTHSDPSVFYQFINDLNASNKEYVGEISHWPESIGNLRQGKWKKFGNNNNFYFVTSATKTIGTCLIRPDFFKSWWLKDFTNGSRIVRPDNPFGPWVEFNSVNRVVPPCEFFRHLDGYGHAKVNAPIAAPLRACCTIIGNCVVHEEWIKGSFFHSKNKPDLPVEPRLDKKNSSSILINLAQLCSAYKVNFKNLWFVNRSFDYKISKYFFLYPLLSFTDKSVLRKTLNLFLPIFSGNVLLFRARMFMVLQYSKLSKRYNLPPSIKEFLRIKL